MNGGDTYSSREGGGRHRSGRDPQSGRSDRDDRRGDRDGERARDRGDRGDRDRRDRRSRSPDYGRSGGGGGRRRGEADEVDSSSSSRMHRDREREERYGGGRDRRGGGGEREWDRDRDRGGAGRGGSRRGADDDDGGRSSRRDGGRDLFDDRVSDRRGGGGRRGDRDRDYDGFGGRDRRRSPSPPPKKREPTPDLTDVVPILERRRRLTQWDIKPPGYENVTAEQAKLSGMFPLPGAPRPQHAVDPSKLQAFMNPSKDGSSAALVNATLRPTNARQSKRIVVRNIPPSATEESLVSFFNLQLNGLNVIESTDPCVGCQMAKDRSFAMLEFRHSSEATVALAFDGISMEAEDYSNGSSDGPQGLKLQRPRDYIVPAVINEPMPEPGVISNVVPDTPNKISVANLPPSLDEEQVKELLSAFGQLKAFVLVRDSGTEESRGVAFAEYADSSVTDDAITGLNALPVADKRIVVRKASIGITQVSGIEMGVNAMSMLAGTTALEADETRVVQLLNMVTPEELSNNDDYEEILEDVRDECSKYGGVLDIKIPRPVGGRQSPGVGKIYVKFDTPDAAKKALRALAGRKFSDRTVVTTFFPEENFEVGAW